MKKQLPAWAVLLIITLVAGLALGGVYALTKEPIAQQALIQAENARKAALPDAERFEELSLPEGATVQWAYAGLKTVAGKQAPLTIQDIDAVSGATYTSQAVVDAINGAYEKYKSAQDQTAVFSAEAEGFLGPVYVEATFEQDTIATLKIGDNRFAETEGLGSKVLEEDFISQFLGGEKPIGYVAQTSVQGFKGPVEIIAGLDADLILTGISVGGADFAETAGLGAKAKEPAFTDQFTGKQTPVQVIKAGGTPGDNTVDAITAATITSNAVRDGVNAVAKYVSRDIMGIADIEMPEKPGDGVYSASARGFAGQVYVEAAFDADGKITYLSVGDDQFAETAGYGAAALEPASQYPFIGVQMPLEMGDVDTLTGATFTKKAIVAALNEAYAASQGAEQPAGAQTPADGPDASIPEGAETYTATAQGLTGTFDVTIAVDENAAVSGLQIGESSSENDVPFLGMVKDNAAFLAQFIGKTPPVADIDVVAGATVSSNAVVEAVNQAWTLSQGSAEEPEETPTVAEAPVSAPAHEAENAGSTVTAQGLTGAFPVTVALNADGTVAAVTLGATESDMDKDFLAKLDDAFLAQFIGKTLPVSGIDAVAGATVSSNAVIEAVNAFAPAEVPAEDAPVAEEHTATAQGLTGAFPVTVALNADGTVAAVTLGATESDMDKDFLAKLDDAFLAQFIGKTLPVTGIDAVAGATVSSNAVIEAVNAFAPAEVPAEDAPAAEEHTATAQGLTGAFPVTVALNADGTVAAVTLGATESDMDKDFLAKLDDAFLAQFIGKTLPVSDIDAVAGATVSSNAVIEAVNAFAPAEVPTEDAPAAEEHTATAQGLTGAFPVTVALNADGTVAAVTLGATESDMDKDFLAKLDDTFLAQFIGKTLPVADIDAVAGATVSSNAVIEAVNGFAPAEVPAGNAATFTADAEGYDSPVAVEASFDGGIITSLVIGDKRFAETEGLGSKALAPEFAAQFIGKAMPISAEDIDGITGATFTTNAVVEALNKAYEKSLTAAPVGAGVAE